MEPKNAVEMFHIGVQKYTYVGAPDDSDGAPTLWKGHDFEGRAI